MILSINAVDEEFASSTGDNVGVSPHTSRFDNPPNASKNLVITSHPDNGDPRLFEVGDRYTVTWGRFGGDGSISDAVVVRSDDASPSIVSGVDRIIVFQGLNEDREIAQIIWTPNFDLERWYRETTNPSQEPEFYTTDNGPGHNHRYVCFATETLIDTPRGPVPAGRLKAGDKITVADGQSAAVVWVGHKVISGLGAHAPVKFEPGSIGNTQALRVSQQYRMALRSPHLDLHFGFEEALAPAKAFVNGNTIRLDPCDRVGYVHILLEEHHVIFANGARCESLYLGDIAANILSNDISFAQIPPSIRSKLSHIRSARPILSLKEAQFILNFGAGHKQQTASLAMAM